MHAMVITSHTCFCCCLPLLLFLSAGEILLIPTMNTCNGSEIKLVQQLRWMQSSWEMRECRVFDDWSLNLTKTKKAAHRGYVFGVMSLSETSHDFLFSSKKKRRRKVVWWLETKITLIFSSLFFWFHFLFLGFANWRQNDTHSLTGMNLLW